MQCVRVTCTEGCGEVEVPFDAVTLTADSEDATAAHYNFYCPDCEYHCERRVSGDVLDFMLKQGYTITKPMPVAATRFPDWPAFTDEDLFEFHREVEAWDGTIVELTA